MEHFYMDMFYRNGILAKGSALDIPAGYRSQKSEVRRQNSSGVGAQHLADFLDQCRELSGVAIAEVVCQDQIVAAFFERTFRHVHESSLVSLAAPPESFRNIGWYGDCRPPHLMR